MEVLSGFGMVFGGFPKDLRSFVWISGGSRGGSEARISGPLRKACPMGKEVFVDK